MNTPMIIVRFSDRTIWEFPASVIAEARAKYYEVKEPGCYQDEFDYTLGDNYELLDWASNNMDWKDVVNYARLIDIDESSDYNEWWVNADREVKRE